MGAYRIALLTAGWGALLLALWVAASAVLAVGWSAWGAHVQRRDADFRKNLRAAERRRGREAA